MVKLSQTRMDVCYFRAQRCGPAHVLFELVQSSTGQARQQTRRLVENPRVRVVAPASRSPKLDNSDPTVQMFVQDPFTIKNTLCPGWGRSYAARGGRACSSSILLVIRRRCLERVMRVNPRIRIAVPTRVPSAQTALAGQ